jgi:outer membrane protein assembly factor BamB
MGDGVIFLTARNSLFAIDPESGMTKWKWEDSRDISARTSAKGLVFVAVNERPTPPARPNRATLHAINAADGQLKWAAGTETIYGVRALYVADSRIYFATDTSLLALELETGRQLWSFSAEGIGAIGATLQADGQHLYLVTYKVSLVRPHHTLRALALTTGQEKWSRGVRGDAARATVHDGAVYAGAYAIDAATGRELRSLGGTGRESAQLISGGRIFLTSPTVTYFGSTRVDQGYLYAVDAKAVNSR